ncbi:MAG: urocanate hydratase [Bdellovibrionales bacterium CG12_big_fil_rev_8_21_14_0_65_38_15]|nr:MAG: urocanate hydratase [Bdellovibrionales bacterium CG22_combo_CG10-13_8_21_14_all_38_13]PIQ55940.1 MAG: urocanate hydratase [Bdellovibrionales bacterium CG12_big_fil_rev_8_21_14_0_65_38_15]PIR29582.1 MAG: urocanate hydratase [Bdellovibrionales bacterium CG11_big_fil_rev_8_21_14_0_20_38_13]
MNIPLPPTGSTLTCKGWHQEAALRCLLNNLHPEVAEDRENLVVYGGNGQAARNHESLEAIIEALKNLEDNQTLLIQSGKPVAVMPSHSHGPRVLIANSNLVPHWANWDTFNEFQQKGLMMYGQMTAGSWIYIGSQGILQGTYETFMAAAEKHYGTGSTLKGKLVLTAGIGGMGGAQPLAVKMADGVCLCCDVAKWRIQKRLDSKYLDVLANSYDEAIEMALKAKAENQAISIGVVGNAADFFKYVLDKNIAVDLVTDQTSAHDPLNGYVPTDMSMEQADDLRKSDPAKYTKLSHETMKSHVLSMLEFQKRGSHVFDYGNNLREGAKLVGLKEAFNFPGFVPAYIRPLFCEGSGPFRWIALSGDPADIHTTDEELKKLFPENKKLHLWLDKAQKMVSFQGLPSRICWLKYGEREQAGLLFNRLVREGKVKAPIVIGRDHLDCGSVASPNRETEGMLDGSDAISDWPLLNLMINTMNGASWTSFHHGGGVGMGYSQHSGMVIVADGTKDMDERISRVLNSDPGMGIVRHVDAGYDIAKKASKMTNIKIPMQKD